MEAKLEREKQKQVHTADPRFKTVVCVHWVSGLCMKGEKCEFLHEMDMDRMPECRLGQRCQEKMCPFKHVKDEERALCNNYSLGFCQHGASCRYQHKKRGGDQLPVVCDFAQVILGGQQFAASRPPPPSVGAGAVAPGAGALPGAAVFQQQRKLNYRTALCQSFSQNGTCNYGENCDFAHSVEEMQFNLSLRMRTLQQQQQQPPAARAALAAAPAAPAKRHTAAMSELDRVVVQLREWNDSDSIDRSYMDPRAFPAPRTVPSLPDDTVGSEPPQFRYFVCRSQDFTPLAASLKHDQWLVSAQVAQRMNAAWHEAKAVFLFFAVNDQECFAGVARMTSQFAPTQQGGAAAASCCGGVQWLRICELAFKKTAYLTAVEPRVQRLLPVALAIEGQELPPSTGHVLMRMLFTEEETQIDRASLALDDSLALAMHPLGPGPKVSAAFAASPPQPMAAVEVGAAAGGFVLPVQSAELLRDFLTQERVGLSEDDAAGAGAQLLQPGSLVFLHASFDGKLYGVLEAISGVEHRWDAKCALPRQFKFRWLVRVGGGGGGDAVPDSALRQRRYGQYSREDTQALVGIFLARAGAGAGKPLPAPLKSAYLESLENGGGGGGEPAAAGVARGLTITQPTQAVAGGSTVFKQSLILNFDFPVKFRAPNRLIGKGGSNMKTIQEQTGASRARVVAADESSSLPDATNGIIEVVLEAGTREALAAAFKQAKDLVDEVLRQWDEFSKPPPPPPPQQSRGGAPPARAPPPPAAAQQPAASSRAPPAPASSSRGGGYAPAEARRQHRSPERGGGRGGGGRRRSPGGRPASSSSAPASAPPPPPSSSSSQPAQRRRDRSRDSDRRRRR